MKLALAEDEKRKSLPHYQKFFSDFWVGVNFPQKLPTKEEIAVLKSKLNQNIFPKLKSESYVIAENERNRLKRVYPFGPFGEGDDSISVQVNAFAKEEAERNNWANTQKGMACVVTGSLVSALALKWSFF